jgi:2-hydroxychromene-2-carboxylate isomerase
MRNAPMVRPVLEFWFELASAYSYLAAMRIEARAERAGVTVRWRPFLLGPVFRAQGWNDSPFNIYPAKGRYMWRDLARICERERLPLKVPPLRFPQNGLKAARLALVGEKAGWIADFTRAVYVANFAEQKDISDDTVLLEILAKLGVTSDALITASTPENKATLKAQNDDAMARGIFGAPSFTIGDELFWGNDRLEEAIAWATRKR